MSIDQTVLTGETTAQGIDVNPYLVLIVTLPDGSRYMPLTRVKNSDQAATFGQLKGTCVPIVVPYNVNPEADVMRWWNEGRMYGWVSSDATFAQYWAAPEQDYKRNGPQFDAYGNFEYGATGVAAGFPLAYLQIAADVAKGTVNNDPINITDINSGYNAIASGGTLSTVEYISFPPPALEFRGKLGLR